MNKKPKGFIEKLVSMSNFEIPEGFSEKTPEIFLLISAKRKVGGFLMDEMNKPEETPEHEQSNTDKPSDSSVFGEKKPDVNPAGQAPSGEEKSKEKPGCCAMTCAYSIIAFILLFIM